MVGTLKALVEAEMGVPVSQQVGGVWIDPIIMLS